MASPLRNEDRLNELSERIRKLRSEIVDLERVAHDMGTDSDAIAAFIVKVQLDRALREYFDLSEQRRDRVCPIHGDPAGVVVGCPDCKRVASKRGGPPVMHDPRFTTP